MLPSETAVIALGVATAGSTDPRIGLLVALAAAGAFLGDNAAYWLGGHLGPVVGDRVFGGARGGRRRAWAERVLDRFGARVIVACRFIPGGRTAVTLTCGLIGYPRRSFVPATACAGVLWASYAFFIGRLGGRAFEDRPWAGLLLAAAILTAVSVLIEVGRRALRWYAGRKARREPGSAVTYGSGERPAGLQRCARRQVSDGGDDPARRRRAQAAGTGAFLPRARRLHGGVHRVRGRGAHAGCHRGAGPGRPRPWAA
ncbi:MAG: DedA family protein [Streptosporangiaceae bacterium]